MKRPIALRRWARPIGLTTLVLAYIGARQNDRAWAIALVVAGLAMVVTWLVSTPDPRFARQFPYEYVADLPSWSVMPRPDALSLGARAFVAVAVAAVVFVAWLPFRTSTAVVPAAFIGIWVFEIPYRPTSRIVRLSIVIGVVVAVVFALARLLTASTMSELAATAFVGAVCAASLAFVGASLYAAAKRHPSRI